MFDTKNVISYTSVQHPSTPLSVHFTSDKFYLGISIEDPKTYEYIIDESIYYIEAHYKVGTRLNDGSLEWKETPIELEPCHLEKFHTKYQTIFSKRALSNMYCIKNFNHTIEGTFLDDKYSFIMFNFYKCENNTKNGNKCKSKEDIDYYLNGTFVSVEFTDISLDPSNYSYPNTPILGELYSTVSNSFFREMHLFLKAVQFKSDRGLVFSSINTQDYIQLDYTNELFSLKTQTKFCSLSLKVTNRIDVYERKYTKFQSTLANIGGIMKAATILGQIITYFYSSISYELNLINKIFFISNEKANQTSNISTKYNMNSYANLNISRKQYQNNILIGSSYVKSLKNNENIKILRKYSSINPIIYLILSVSIVTKT